MTPSHEQPSAPDRQWRTPPNPQDIHPGDLVQLHETDTEWRVVEPPGDLTAKHDVTQIGVVIRSSPSLGGVKMLKDVTAYRPCPERNGASFQVVEDAEQQTLDAIAVASGRDG